MKWNYQCPHCGQARTIDWDKRAQAHECHVTKLTYYPPTPTEQKTAYVDTHNWPVEMEDAVVALKGKQCTVPGCTKKYETLDHKVAWDNNGKTSIDNLFPMCNEHNQSKGAKDYEEWLEDISPRTPLEKLLNKKFI